MLFKNILVAYDTSDSSRKALQTAMEMATENPETKLEVVYVMEIPPSYNARVPHFLEFEKNIHQESLKKLEEVTNLLKDIPNETKTTLLKGASPAHEILKHIKDGPQDLIIIGNRGLSSISELLGGVSHTIVQKAQIPVLVVK